MPKVRMDQAPECINCHQEMRLVKTLKPTPNRQYRIRKFHCDLCDYSESVYGTGEIDEININNAIEESNKI